MRHIAISRNTLAPALAWEYLQRMLSPNLKYVRQEISAGLTIIGDDLDDVHSLLDLLHDSTWNCFRLCSQRHIFEQCRGYLDSDSNSQPEQYNHSDRCFTVDQCSYE